MRRFAHIVISAAILLSLCSVASALERFAPPQFEGDYEMPGTTTPAPRHLFYGH